MVLHQSHSTFTDQSRATSAGDLNRIQVLLVDDHPAIRLGVRMLIDDQPDMRVLAEADGIDDALSKLERPADVAIVDYDLGERRDGLWLTAHIKRLALRPRVLVYSAFADVALAVTALIAGADGLLPKHALGQELCRAIRMLARGIHHLPAIPRSVAQAMHSRLAPDDHAIFGMLLHGTAPEAIAEQLGITLEELHARRAAILQSLKTDRTPLGSSPLDYERPKRRAGGRPA